MIKKLRNVHFFKTTINLFFLVSDSVSQLIENEIKSIQKEDDETEFWGDYVEDNYDSTGYFPTYEEDRR